jgi:hypothetical protein
VHANVAVPLTGCEELPLCILSGAVPVIVTVPGATHVAAPLSSMVAIVVSDVDHTKPSDESNARVDPLSSVPVAEKAVWPCELLIAVAVLGDIETLVRR